MSGMLWSMSGQFWQIAGIVTVIILVAIMLTRPSSILPVVLAVGVVIAAVIVTWNQVEAYRAQKGLPEAETAAGITTAPPPGSPRLTP
jgi:hypothetical protein